MLFVSNKNEVSDTRVVIYIYIRDDIIHNPSLAATQLNPIPPVPPTQGQSRVPQCCHATWPKENVFGTTRSSLDLSRMLASLLPDLDCHQRQDTVMTESVCDLAENFFPLYTSVILSGYPLNLQGY